jgi:hypothetical protein
MLQVEDFIYTNGGLEPVEFKVYFLADCKVRRESTPYGFYNPMHDALDIETKVEVTGIDYNDKALDENSSLFNTVKEFFLKCERVDAAIVKMAEKQCGR